MNLNLTPAQAAILYRLLSESGTTLHGDAIGSDLNSDDMWSLWNQLDDKMGERGIPRQSHAEMGEQQQEPPALRLAAAE